MNAPREEEACRVVIDPSLPCDIALSIGTTSRPRTSPTSTRSGDIRSAHRTSSTTLPADLPGVLSAVSLRLQREYGSAVRSPATATQFGVTGVGTRSGFYDPY